MRSIVLSIAFFVLAKGNFSVAQEIDLDNLQIDSSKITLRVLIMKGCVISPVNALDFEFYPDSTLIRFYPDEYGPTGRKTEEFEQVIVPYNLWNRIKKYQELLEQEGRGIKITDNPLYRLEFDRFVGYGEYRISPEEHLILFQLFEEFSKESQSKH